MALIAAGLRVKKFPTALGRSVNSVFVARDKVVKRRIKGQLCAFIGGDGSQKIWAIGWAAKDMLRCLLVFLDTGDLCHSSIQVRTPHLTGINNRKSRLLLKRLSPPVPELCFIVERVENRRGIALADTAFDADGSGLPIGKRELRIMAGVARDSAVS